MLPLKSTPFSTTHGGHLTSSISCNSSSSSDARSYQAREWWSNKIDPRQMNDFDQRLTAFKKMKPKERRELPYRAMAKLIGCLGTRMAGFETPSDKIAWMTVVDEWAQDDYEVLTDMPTANQAGKPLLVENCINDVVHDDETVDCHAQLCFWHDNRFYLFEPFAEDARGWQTIQDIRPSEVSRFIMSAIGKNTPIELISGTHEASSGECRLATLMFLQKLHLARGQHSEIQAIIQSARTICLGYPVKGSDTTDCV